MTAPIVATIAAGATTYNPVVRRYGYAAGTAAGFACADPNAWRGVAAPLTTIPTGANGENLVEEPASGVNPLTISGANRLTAGGAISVASGQRVILPDTFRCFSATAFTGEINDSVLTASDVVGTLAKGQTLWIAGGKSARVVTRQLTGSSGGAGTYDVSNGDDVASGGMAAHHAEVLINIAFKHEEQTGSNNGMGAFVHADNTGSKGCWGAYVNAAAPNNYNFLAAGAPANTLAGLVPGSIYLISQLIEVNGDGTRRSRIYLNGAMAVDSSRAFVAWPALESAPLIGYLAADGSALTDGWIGSLYEMRIDHMTLDPVNDHLDLINRLMARWYSAWA